MRIRTSSATIADAFPADGAVTMMMTAVTARTRSTASRAAVPRVSSGAPTGDASRASSAVTDSDTARTEAMNWVVPGVAQRRSSSVTQGSAFQAHGSVITWKIVPMGRMRGTALLQVKYFPDYG